MILARQYRDGGAAALSVLTEREHFYGHYEFIDVAKKATGLPVLCKDFFVDQYQIYHAKRIGADAVLLIVRLLEPDTLRDFLRQAHSVGLACLVEAHTEDEVRTAVDCGAEIIGVNNRDLDDFTVSLETAERLAPLISSSVVKVAESGIFTPEDIMRLRNAGYDAFLIGEALVKSNNPAELLKSLQQV
jgi:indole-3-glycerol phosphate synthase